MSYEINEVVIIDGNRNIVNAGVGTFSKVKAPVLEVGSAALQIADILDEDNLASDSATALVTQQSVKAYVDSAVSALQADVDQNEADSDTADANHNSRLLALEADPTTQTLLTAEATARANADSALSSRVTSLEADPTTQTLLDAEATTRENGDITLTGLISTLTTTVSNLASDVDQNEADADQDAADLAALSGVSLGSTTLGSFTGSTISANNSIKEALQDLENGVDNALGGGAAASSVEVESTSADAAHYLTFVNDDNVSGVQENLYTDAGVQYNPFSNILTVGEIVITGNLTVNGSQTVIDTTTIQAQDKNITLGVSSTASDATADGGGFTLQGTTDKTFVWLNSTDSLTSSENIDLATGKSYHIDNANVLSKTTLGASVVNSSLTSVGTLTDLTVTGAVDLNSTVDIDQNNLRIGGVSMTATAAELNRVDGALAGSAVASKAVVLDASKDVTGINQLQATTLIGALVGNADSSDQVKTVRVNTSAVHYLTFVDGDNTSQTNEELNTSLLATFNPSDGSLVANKLTASSNFYLGLTEVTSTGTELNYLDGSTPGTATASNAVVLDSSRDIANVNNIDITGNLVGDGASNISGIASVTASGKMFAQNFTTTSDAALKENVAEIEGAVAKVEAIRGVTFDWKDGSGSTAGVIAQEVEAVLPSIVVTGEHKAVDYNGLIGLLVEAVKELSAEVKGLKG